MNIANSISDLIGKTPLLRLNKISSEVNATILVKLESMNPGGSVKDRLALAMISAAEKQNLIDNETVIIEPTSGNTGIGLAMICAERAYKLVVTMPESVSLERRALLRAYGAELVLTAAEKGMKGSIEKAIELSQNFAKSFIPQQFNNLANPEMHRRTTALEIWNDTDGKVDIFVAGAGTGGTITGVSEVLKQRNAALQSIVVEPFDSPVLSGGNSGKHPIQGIGAGFIPKILNTKIYDEIFKVTGEQAIKTARQLALQEGILAGISSGANVFAALEIAKRPENKGKTIVTIICDTGERYLSTPLYNIENNEI